MMDFHYEIKNKKLKAMVEKKAKQLNMSPDELVWGYINRGLMFDELNEKTFRELHSEKFLKEINTALNVD